MPGIGAVLAAKYEKGICFLSQLLSRSLSLCGSRANGTHHFVVPRTLLLSHAKQKVKLLCLKSSLADYPIHIFNRKRFQIVGRFHNPRVHTCPSLDTLHLGMTLLPNDNDETAFFCQFSSRFLCLPHMRTSGINNRQSTGFGFLINLRSNAVGSEYNHITGLEFGQLFFTLYTLLLQLIYNTGIMNQFTQSGNTIIIPF